MHELWRTIIWVVGLAVQFVTEYWAWIAIAWLVIAYVLNVTEGINRIAVALESINERESRRPQEWI